jgi:hypothetical protein
MLRPNPKIVTLRHIDYDGRFARDDMMVSIDEEEERRRRVEGRWACRVGGRCFCIYLDSRILRVPSDEDQMRPVLLESS